MPAGLRGPGVSWHLGELHGQRARAHTHTHSHTHTHRWTERGNPTARGLQMHFSPLLGGWGMLTGFYFHCGGLSVPPFLGPELMRKEQKSDGSPPPARGCSAAPSVSRTPGCRRSLRTGSWDGCCRAFLGGGTPTDRPPRFPVQPFSPRDTHQGGRFVWDSAPSLEINSHGSPEAPLEAHARERGQRRHSWGAEGPVRPGGGGTNPTLSRSLGGREEQQALTRLGGV